MGIPASQVEKALCSAVADTLGSGGPAAVFASHMYRTKQWQRSKRTGPPPFLALLAVFCMAAEQMAAADGMSSANYFGRLRKALGYTAADTKIDTAYRRVAERLWGALNSWLVELDGRRGLPTAYALTFRFVGLPVSQALVRKSDRDRLNEFFRRFGFAPGTDVPPSELRARVECLAVRATVPCIGIVGDTMEAGGRAGPDLPGGGGSAGLVGRKRRPEGKGGRIADRTPGSVLGDRWVPDQAVCAPNPAISATGIRATRRLHPDNDARVNDRAGA